jgi:hypothetical protein
VNCEKFCEFFFWTQQQSMGDEKEKEKESIKKEDTIDLMNNLLSLHPTLLFTFHSKKSKNLFLFNSE